MSRDAVSTDSTPSVDFTTLVLSFRHVALMALGLLDDEHSASFPPDPEAARMQIDMIRVLKDKTIGNLSDDENKLVDSVLYELRVAFVEHGGK